MDQKYKIEHIGDNSIRFNGTDISLTVYIEQERFAARTDPPYSEEYFFVPGRAVTRPRLYEVDAFIQKQFDVKDTVHIAQTFLKDAYGIDNSNMDKSEYVMLFIAISCYLMEKAKMPFGVDLVDKGKIYRGKTKIELYKEVFRKMWKKELYDTTLIGSPDEHIIWKNYNLTPGISVKPTVLPELKIARPSVQFKFD